MAGRPILAIASLIFTAGAVVLLFFIILSGAINAPSVNHVWFLQADTQGIGSAPSQAQWTLWSVCDGGTVNMNCGKAKPAYPFDPPSNFGTANGLDPFNGMKKYYYLSRFSFAFFLISLVFSVCTFFTGFLAVCTRLGGGLSGVFATFALFFQTLTAALVTAWTVMGRNAFRSIGRSAKLGSYGLGLTWAAMACLLISTILFFLVCGGSSRKSRGGGEAVASSGSSFKRWDSFYTTELSSAPSESTDWFSTSNATRRITTYTRETLQLPLGSSILDLGCGNGRLVFSLAEAGFGASSTAKGRLLGVDYSETAVQLAREVGRGLGYELGRQVELRKWDVLKGDVKELGGLEVEAGWDLVLDKGTFDAVCLSTEEETGEGAGGRRAYETYPEKVAGLVKSGGRVLVTSCNWTEEELKVWFERDGTLKLEGQIEYPTFKFGGKTGQAVCSVCFRKD
ncbi:MAG: hypothetical protein M1814_002875 [Vezdaea aestivalis]|nr:MAG: hypothetical protein M1814_002875 [Vezdaea aestivalis]